MSIYRFNSSEQFGQVVSQLLLARAFAQDAAHISVALCDRKVQAGESFVVLVV